MNWLPRPAEGTAWVAPSLLSADFANLGPDIKDVTRAGADLLHLDVMDAHFVPNLTFGPFICAAIRKLSHLPLDAHLMMTPARPVPGALCPQRGGRADHPHRGRGSRGRNPGPHWRAGHETGHQPESGHPPGGYPALPGPGGSDPGHERAAGGSAGKASTRWRWTRSPNWTGAGRPRGWISSSTWMGASTMRPAGCAARPEPTSWCPGPGSWGAQGPAGPGQAVAGIIAARTRGEWMRKFPRRGAVFPSSAVPT